MNCLNALSGEYWWPPRVYPDSISIWAKPAYDEALKITYELGLATSNMHLGVAEIYRKNFLTAEKYLSLALQTLDSIHNELEFGWCKHRERRWRRSGASARLKKDASLEAIGFAKLSK